MVGVVGVDPAVVVAARRDKMERSDICSRCATGGIRARVAGRRLTSDFMSDKSSSSWFRTYIRNSTSNNTLPQVTSKLQVKYIQHIRAHYNGGYMVAQLVEAWCYKFVPIGHYDFPSTN